MFVHINESPLSYYPELVSPLSIARDLAQQFRQLS